RQSEQEICDTSNGERLRRHRGAAQDPIDHTLKGKERFHASPSDLKLYLALIGVSVDAQNSPTKNVGSLVKLRCACFQNALLIWCLQRQRRRIAIGFDQLHSGKTGVEAAVETKLDRNLVASNDRARLRN